MSWGVRGMGLLMISTEPRALVVGICGLDFGNTRLNSFFVSYFACGLSSVVIIAFWLVNSIPSFRNPHNLVGQCWTYAIFSEFLHKQRAAFYLFVFLIFLMIFPWIRCCCWLKSAIRNFNERRPHDHPNFPSLSIWFQDHWSNSTVFSFVLVAHIMNRRKLHHALSPNCWSKKDTQTWDTATPNRIQQLTPGDDGQNNLSSRWPANQWFKTLNGSH